MSKRISNGAILYEGASLFNQQPIVAIVNNLITPTSNRKTGDMLQVFVLPTNHIPTEALKNKADKSVCGSCPLKQNICYVNPITLNQIWRSYKKGNYKYINDDVYNYIKTNKFKVRLTAYGEATAIPFKYWQKLIHSCDGLTGYTHTWRTCEDIWKRYLMASIHSPWEKEKALSKGWRTFRIVLPDESLETDEVYCKYSTDKMQCQACMLCNGTQSNSKSVVDIIHGTRWKINNFELLRNK